MDLSNLSNASAKAGISPEGLRQMALNRQKGSKAIYDVWATMDMDGPETQFQVLQAIIEEAQKYQCKINEECDEAMRDAFRFHYINHEDLT